MKKIVVLFAAVALVFVSCKTTTPTEEPEPEVVAPAPAKPEPEVVAPAPVKPEPEVVAPAPAKPESEVNFGEIRGKLWKLSEIRFIDDTIHLRKKGRSKDPLGEFYTVYISDSEIAGTAAPSTFRVSYSGDTLESLNFGVLEIDPLTYSGTLPTLPFVEDDCLAYVDGIKRIELIKDQALILYTEEENGNEVSLVFITEN
ncbi:MAG: hypothetical protein LBO67_05920 [Spirochaetaceae bacterium]|jgi:hypothetical protein|nr:hypothetical protein [Spirochaetaceae bacterium]